MILLSKKFPNFMELEGLSTPRARLLNPLIIDFSAGINFNTIFLQIHFTLDPLIYNYSSEIVSSFEVFQQKYC
jgi:hypothetical protein